MRVHVFQHAPFEGPGWIESSLRAAGHTVTATPLYAGGEPPAAEAVDMLVVMGGPMSVNDEAEFGWLAPEKGYVRDMARSGKPVLGVCLGAQLIADALGARVYPNSEKEIGWFPVEGVTPAGADCFAFPESAEVFHWHGETFDLPEGAVRLARSRACENQAFQLGRSVIGLQFHLETTPESAAGMVEHCRAELTPARYVQGEDDILAAGPEKYANANALMDRVLAYLTAGK